MAPVAPIIWAYGPPAENFVVREMQPGGELSIYQFTVPEGILALEVRLENMVGDLYMHLNEDDRIPGGRLCCRHSADHRTDQYTADTITVANPVPVPTH